MKRYDDFDKYPIGGSDIAALLLSGPSGPSEPLTAKYINFGEDGEYSAYIVEGEAEIGTHYSLVAEFYNWMNVYDDDSLAVDFKAPHIKVFRAGERGCIIQLLD